MTPRRARPELQALLPWLAAAFLWFTVLPPIRSDEAGRLAEQSAIRHDRVRADRAAREVENVRIRMGAALGGLCRASSDPAALRQRAVAATSGLPLSPLSLSVIGGPGGGASVEAAGPRHALITLARRLGDPGRGGFIRSVSLREKGALSSLSVTTGVFDSVPSGLLPTSVRPACREEADFPPDAPRSDANAAVRAAIRTTRPLRPAVPLLSQTEPVASAPLEAAVVPPFALVAFVSSAGRTRVSLRAGEEVRFADAGDVIAGWRCVNVDRDAGAEFVSPSGVRVTLRAPR